MKIMTMLSLFLLASPLGAENKAKIKEVKLWAESVPSFPKAYQHKDFTKIDARRITNISEPFMRIFPAKGMPTKKAMVILPGGGYSFLAHQHEGDVVAKHFAAQGVTCFVACYRVTNGKQKAYQFPGPLLDARQAIKMAKESAETYGFDPEQVGVMGFSAGGHLASLCGTLYDKKFEHETASDFTVKPAFVALIYPVASMLAPTTHKGSKKSLLGLDPSPELVRLASPELNVQKNVPRLFIAHDRGDPVDAQLSINLAEAWKKAGGDTELHIFEGEKHGFGLAQRGKTEAEHPANAWPKLFAQFLKAQEKE